MSTHEIIILGGGIVGKTAALAFSQKGLKVLHIAANFGDKSNTIPSNSEKDAWNSRVYAISHSSEQLFKDLQIWQAIDPSRRQVVEQMRIYGDSGEVADGIHFSAFEANLPKTNVGIFKAPLVIAADGANSLIRTQVGIEISQDLYEHTAVIGNFACENQHLRTAHQWFLDNGDVLALLPLPNKKVSMVWSTSEANAAHLVDLSKNDPDLLCQFISSQAQG